RLGEAGREGKPGSGLGLAICRHLVLLMGGRIGWESTASGGNTFWLTLPVVVAPSGAAAVMPAERSAVLLPRTRVLLAEDAPANQLITATMLRRAGHCVDAVGSGEEALQAAKCRPYDIIFMDILMPGMTGFEAARRIRALRGSSTAVPIVALTASVSEVDRALSKAAGMQGILGKPADFPELIDVMARHVWSIRVPTPEQPEPVSGPEPGPASDGALHAPLDWSRLTDLRENLPPGSLGSLVESCLRDLRERLPLLRQALATADAEAIEGEAHAMVGIAGTYGMASLEARLRSILIAARRGDAREAAEGARDLERELERAGAALREALHIEAA
ncbi:MAG: response regulator, partial [Acetobacteraceae bacterium]|nr:response regulator [Acetobacteraceae bacterium]